MAPESCSDEVAVVLLINAAAGTAPFVRNLPILVLQFEPEVGTGTEAQRILRRAASIMLRRLDAVRERLAESSALESLLTARNS